MRLKINTTKDDFYKTYLKVFSSVLGISNSEVNILAEFCKIKSKLEEIDSPIDVKKLLFSTESRKAVQEALGISSFNLSNYILALKKKGLLIKNENKYDISPIIYVYLPKETFNLSFDINIQNNGND